MCTVHVNETVELPPRTESVLPASVRFVFDPGITGIVEPNRSLSERYHVCAATTLVTLDEDMNLPVRLLNPTSAPITLYKDTVVGRFTSLGEKEIAVIDKQAFLSTSEVPKDTCRDPAKEVDLSQTDLTQDQKDQLKSLLSEFRDVFAFSNYELGKTDLIQHHIETEGPPIKQRPYRVSEKQRQCIEKHVNDMLERNIISESLSPWSSPVVLVPKGNSGETRFCVDYRKLNKVTKRDSFPLPLIESTLDALGGSQYFTTLDLLSGYWQIEVNQESKEKTAFTTFGGLYEFNVLPFGLTNAPSSFQRLMESVLRGLNYKIALCYIDDILIFSRSFTEHLEHIREVFLRLRSANLRLKPSKCDFATKSVKFLGHVITRDGISPNPEKISAVKNFPIPKCAKEVRSFLGLANYYRRFVNSFAKIAAPLNALLCKDKKFSWSEQCQLAFDTLKTALCESPILAYPDFSLPFSLHTDASDYAVGYVLSQKQNGLERVIAYAGRNLTPAEKNYSVTEKEGVALISGIQRFKPYLHGRKFTVYTDHSALKYLFTNKNPQGRLARWNLILQEYDLEIVYKQGIKNGNADALSRRSYDINVLDFPSITLNRVVKCQQQDPEVNELLQFLYDGTLPSDDKRARRILLEEENYFISEEGLLCYLPLTSTRTQKENSPRLVVPQSLKYEILVHCHDSPLAGLLRFQKTYDKIKLRYLLAEYV